MDFAVYTHFCNSGTSVSEKMTRFVGTPEIQNFLKKNSTMGDLLYNGDQRAEEVVTCIQFFCLKRWLGFLKR
jgi:hypothetical protein